MIKTINILILSAALVYSSCVDADYMAPYDIASCNKVFLSLEGSYTKNTISNFEFTVLSTSAIVGTNNTFFSTKNNQSSGGRLAAGIMGKLYDELAVSGELGWGYYGRNNLDLLGAEIFSIDNPSSIMVTNTITGFDLLLGAIFLQPCYNVFLKAGALVEINNFNLNADNFPIIFPTHILTTETFHLTGSKLGILPAIKFGGSYLFSENWALTVAYMHAFGSNTRTVAFYNPITLSSKFDANLHAPSLHSVMVGLQFSL